jgi:4-oxalocrotonate tautomerase
MPVITVAMHPTTPEVKKALITSLTETAVNITGIPVHSFIVFIDEHNDDAIGVGGKTLKEIRGSHS